MPNNARVTPADPHESATPWRRTTSASSDPTPPSAQTQTDHFARQPVAIQPGPARIEPGVPSPDAGISPPTTDQLSHERLVRRAKPRPTSGWRAAVYLGTGGRINPGLSPAEAAERELTVRIRAQLGGCHTVTVASMKGGVGKTTIAALLGLALAAHRGDRIVALDANPDAGTLADRVLGRPALVTVRHLLNNAASITSQIKLAEYTGLAGRLEVLASEHDPAKSEAFNAAEYNEVLDLLQRFYNIIITDSGTGLVHSAMSAALRLTKTLVVVGAPTVDAARRAGTTLDWLSEHGHRELAANAIVALSCDRSSRHVDDDGVRAHFEARGHRVVEIPADPHLATGAHIQLSELAPSTRFAALELAALVAGRFRWTHAVEPPR